MLRRRRHAVGQFQQVGPAIPLGQRVRGADDPLARRRLRERSLTRAAEELRELVQRALVAFALPFAGVGHACSRGREHRPAGDGELLPADLHVQEFAGDPGGGAGRQRDRARRRVGRRERRLGRRAQADHVHRALAPEHRPEDARFHELRALRRAHGPGALQLRFRVLLFSLLCGEKREDVVRVGLTRADAIEPLEVAGGAIFPAEGHQRLRRLEPESVAARSEIHGVLVGDDRIRFVALRQRQTRAEDLRERELRGGGERDERSLHAIGLALLQIPLRLPEIGHPSHFARLRRRGVERFDVAGAGGERAAEREQGTEPQLGRHRRGDFRRGGGRTDEARVFQNGQGRAAGGDDDGEHHQHLPSHGGAGRGERGGEEACDQRGDRREARRFRRGRGDLRHRRKDLRRARLLRQDADVGDAVVASFLRHLQHDAVVDAGGVVDTEHRGALGHRRDDRLQLPRAVRRRPEARLDLFERVGRRHLLQW